MLKQIREQCTNFVFTFVNRSHGNKYYKNRKFERSYSTFKLMKLIGLKEKVSIDVKGNKIIITPAEKKVREGYKKNKDNKFAILHSF